MIIGEKYKNENGIRKTVIFSLKKITVTKKNHTSKKNSFISVKNKDTHKKKRLSDMSFCRKKGVPEIYILLSDFFTQHLEIWQSSIIK